MICVSAAHLSEKKCILLSTQTEAKILSQMWHNQQTLHSKILPPSDLNEKIIGDMKI